MLVRILTGDDARRQGQARAYLRAHCNAEAPAFINDIVALETVWVLERRYGYSRDQIADAFEHLRRTATLAFEADALLADVLEEYRAGADFSEAFISRRNTAHGCMTTLTFDRHAAARLAGFTMLD